MFITQKFYIASCSCGAQRLFERTATDYLQWVGQSLCRFDQCSDPFFRTKTAYVTVIVLFVVIVFPGFGNVDKIAERIYRFEEVESVYLISGEFDLAVMIEGKSMREVANFVSSKLSPLESVLSTSTNFILKKYKEHGLALTDETIEDERMLITP